MTGLSRYNPIWEQARAGGDPGRVYQDDAVLIATDFEGGNGTNIRRLGDDYYALELEPEPGSHPYSDKAYYFCFGVRNLLPGKRTVRVRLEVRNGWDNWPTETQHVVLRRGGAWSQLDPAAIPPVHDALAVEVDLPLPGGDEPDNVLFASNFHWWPYTEGVQYLHSLEGVRVREIGRSYQGRAIYAVEMGNDDGPCMVHAQTPQPSEMGDLVCKALIDYLRSDDPEAVAILARFKVCFVPMSNPDGTVLGYGVSDAQGRFPYFEGDLAAGGDPNATPEMVTLWKYLVEQRPWLFWDWHSNNWARRPGHMLLRYSHDLMEDPKLKRLWDDLEEGLLALPNTHHGSWTTPTEGSYRNSLGYQAVTRLGIISCMIKQHDKYPLAECRDHAIASLKLAAAEYVKAMG